MIRNCDVSSNKDYCREDEHYYTCATHCTGHLCNNVEYFNTPQQGGNNGQNRLTGNNIVYVSVMIIIAKGIIP